MEMAREAGSTSNTVIVATSRGFADTLSVAPWSYASASPIVLAGSDGLLTAAAVSAISSDSLVTRVLVVGGTGVVGDVEGQLAGLGVDVVRLWGQDRYATSEAVASWSAANGLGWESPAVATGRNFPDALAGAALCGVTGQVLVLTDEADDVTVELLREHASQVEETYVLGGTSAVSEGLAREVAEAVS